MTILSTSRKDQQVLLYQTCHKTLSSNVAVLPQSHIIATLYESFLLSTLGFKGRVGY